MLVNIAFIFIFFVIAFLSTTHALGLWLVVLLIHGLIVIILGPIATHVPLYSGLTITVVILARRQWGAIPTSVLVSMTFFVGIMLLASVLGINAEHSFSIFMVYLKGILLALLLAGCLNNEDDIRLVTLYCLTGLIVGALYAIYQHVTGTYAISSIYQQRVAGLRGDPNDTAMLLVTGIPLAAYWLFRSTTVSKAIFFTSIMCLLIYGIALTGSRGGMVTLVLLIGIILIRKPSLKIGFAAVILGFALLALAPATFMERMGSLFTGKEKHGAQSMDIRASLQRNGIQIFLDHPAVGVGPGNFGLAYAQHVSSGNIFSSKHIEYDDLKAEYGVAHNMHLEFFVENGLFGGLILWSLFYQSLRSMFRYDRLAGYKDGYEIGIALASALAGMLFAGLFLSQGKNSVLWFMLGIGFAMQKILVNLQYQKKHNTRRPIPMVGNNHTYVIK